MNKLSAGEISERAERYKQDLPYSDTKIEQRITSVLNSQSWLVKEHVADCIRWNLQNQGGRAGHNVDRLDGVSEPVVEYTTKAAFIANDPKQQVKILAALPGVGTATATVLLAFNDPENYAIGDRYMNHELLGEDSQIKPTDYPKLLEELRDLAPESIPLRTVEKAYYQRYLEENDL